VSGECQTIFGESLGGFESVVGEWEFCLSVRCLDSEWGVTKKLVLLVHV
jgi:hypothetical protein